MTLLVKISKSKDENEAYDRELLLPIQDQLAGSDSASVGSEGESFELKENLHDQIWPIRKDLQGNIVALITAKVSQKISAS